MSQTLIEAHSHTPQQGDPANDSAETDDAFQRYADMVDDLNHAERRGGYGDDYYPIGGAHRRKSDTVPVFGADDPFKDDGPTVR